MFCSVADGHKQTGGFGRYSYAAPNDALLKLGINKHASATNGAPSEVRNATLQIAPNAHDQNALRRRHNVRNEQHRRPINGRATRNPADQKHQSTAPKRRSAKSGHSQIEKHIW